MTQQILQSSYSRMFFMPNGSSPRTAPKYQGLWRAGAASWDNGKVTPVYIPDPNQYGHFTIAGKVVGEPGLPQLSVDALYTADLSDLLKAVAGGCDHDVQIHFGICKNPSDSNGGWDKILVLETAKAGGYSSKDFGALEPSQTVSVTETVKFEGLNMYELKPLVFAQKASLQTVTEVVGVCFCDTVTCGICNFPSDGCQVIFAVAKSSAGSAGLLASVIFSIDGGNTWLNDAIDSLAANSQPTAIACVGGNTIVLSATAGAIEYAKTADIVNGVEIWTQVVTGFVASKGPLAIASLGQTVNFIAGQGGYLYFSADLTNGVSVLDPGVATTQDLLDIKAFDLDTILAVGNNNAIVASFDGGITWASITGPVPGTALNCCWMQSATEWWVGTAAGRLFFTTDGGVTWVSKNFPGSGAGLGVVRDIRFVTESVGYLAHSTSANKGRILRTIDGGYSWYVLPEGTNVMPTNNFISRLACCPNPNVVVGGGLASGTTGILVAGR